MTNRSSARAILENSLVISWPTFRVPDEENKGPNSGAPSLVPRPKLQKTGDSFSGTDFGTSLAR